MIELTDIHKFYDQLHVLKGISLEINEGEIMAIVGPSGAGKTTLLQIAGTLDLPDSGEVKYRGIEVTKLSDKKLSSFRNLNIGFVFQFHQLLPEFTALENVMLPALIAGANRKDASKKAKELLDVLGLENRMAHYPSELSGGERQRVAVARALINDPDVVFADEPTGSLDSKNREEIQQMFVELQKRFGQTFVIVTHDVSLAEIADRVVIMKDGCITDIRDNFNKQKIAASQNEIS